MRAGFAPSTIRPLVLLAKAERDPEILAGETLCARMSLTVA